MNDGFGDDEPEDAWDPDDPIPELVDNLFRRLALLGLTRRGEAGDDADERLDDLAQMITAARHLPDLSPRDELRVSDLADDLLHIRNRLGGQ